MAPEVVMGKGLGRFADIWSLGCTVFEMLTGTPPWADKNSIAVLFQVAQERTLPEYPDNISEELRDFLNCCFKREPTQRWNVYELKHHPFILQDKYNDVTCQILESGLTHEDQEFVTNNSNQYPSSNKSVPSSPPKSPNLNFLQNRESMKVSITPPQEDQIKLKQEIEEVKMSKEQIKAIYQLVEQDK